MIIDVDRPLELAAVRSDIESRVMELCDFGEDVIENVVMVKVDDLIETIEDLHEQLSYYQRAGCEARR